MKKKLILFIIFLTGCSSTQVCSKKTCEFTCKSEGYSLNKINEKSCLCKNNFPIKENVIESPTVRQKPLSK